MGKHTVQMRELMRELHLSAPHEGSIPEDFLPYELDVLLVLYTLLEEHKDNTALYTGLDQARQWLEGHLHAWLPLCIEKARSEGPRTAPLEHVFHILEAWIVSLNSKNSNANEENL